MEWELLWAHRCSASFGPNSPLASVSAPSLLPMNNQLIGSVQFAAGPGGHLLHPACWSRGRMARVTALCRIGASLWLIQPRLDNLILSYRYLFSLSAVKAFSTAVCNFHQKFCLQQSAWARGINDWIIWKYQSWYTVSLESVFLLHPNWAVLVDWEQES